MSYICCAKHLSVMHLQTFAVRSTAIPPRTICPDVGIQGLTLGCIDMATDKTFCSSGSTGDVARTSPLGHKDELCD